MKDTNSLNRDGVENLLYKYTEKMATNKAEAIEDFLFQNIPAWQRKTILKLPFLAKLFGWRLEEKNTLVEKGKTLTQIDLYQRNKPKNTLMIIETIEGL